MIQLTRNISTRLNDPPPETRWSRQIEVSPGPSLISPDEADELIEKILCWANLDFNEYRRPPLRRRVPACLRALRAKTLDQAREILDRRPELHPAALSALVIGVTEFNRDPELFTTLAREILPDLLTRRACPRIWSAGCSSGEELYTVAMLLAEAGRLEGAFLLGTDCRKEAVAKARTGGYPPQALRRLDPELRDRYLECRNGQWFPTELLRRVPQWHRADLLAGVQAGPWDLILWQNVAIYLEPTAVKRLWEQLVGQLRPGGFLITGPAERPPANLNLICVRRRIYRRMEE